MVDFIGHLMGFEYLSFEFFQLLFKKYTFSN